MSSVRQDKVAALIKREMAVIFQQYGNDLFKGSLITVTQARVSPDLGVARLYISIFPPAKRVEAMESIQHHTSQLRKYLGERVGKQLRKIPELTFFMDDSLDYSDEIDKLLKG
ncbi:MAG: ribosome-binding factor [Bacteroidota bacterium]